mmetsp:Transcript_45489/g.131722  ORF Transcript_45489/g.131722 Transcript_45489/m.131722 type:complete len:209 (-) Transcript_45489:160-786(-)
MDALVISNDNAVLLRHQQHLQHVLDAAVRRAREGLVARLHCSPDLQVGRDVSVQVLDHRAVEGPHHVQGGQDAAVAPVIVLHDDVVAGAVAVEGVRHHALSHLRQPVRRPHPQLVEQQVRRSGHASVQPGLDAHARQDALEVRPDHVVLGEEPHEAPADVADAARRLPRGGEGPGGLLDGGVRVQERPVQASRARGVADGQAAEDVQA